MKAVVYSEYGPPEVLKVKEISTPVPGDNEVLVRNYATTVNYGDLTARNFPAISPREFNMPMLFWIMAKLYFGSGKPRNGILGSEFAGEIAAVGKNVTTFKPGDRVFGYLGQAMGAYAQYIRMPESGCLTTMPAGLSYEEAAVLPYGAIMALPLLRKMQIRAGQKVLINGASGGIGSAAVQIAKHFGAEVTGVCGGQRMNFVQSLGADKVIDYAKEDFTRNGETYDLIIDIRGRLQFSRIKGSLKTDGRILYVSFKAKHLFLKLWTSLFGSRKVHSTLAPGSVEDLHAVRDMVEAGSLKSAAATRFPIEHAATAHRQAEEGSNKGSIVLTVWQDSVGVAFQ